MNEMERPLAYARANRERFVSELKTFVRFPTVSAQPRHAADLQKCAGWLGAHLKRIGLQRVRVIPTAGHPIVYAEWRRLRKAPTVLIYGHYDVQPVDPLNEWKTPPFEPAIRGDDLLGRGVSDDKGQLFTHVKAIESYLQNSGALPVNIKCLFEGEEEILSAHLERFIERNRQALAADIALISDTRMLGPDRPALTYSTRGQLSLDLEVIGQRHDLHAGNFGGAIYNPAQALCEIIAQLHDRRGRVAIPGFYDRVRLESAAERGFLRRTGPSDHQILHDAKTSLGWGESDYSLYERVALRPALTVNGISGGYAGAGTKGIIPARALAKLSFRLVPEQNHREVEQLFRRQLARITPPAVKSMLRIHSSAQPAVIDRRHPALRAAGKAYERAFGRWPVLLRSGGSLPVVSLFREILGIPTVLMGFALPDDRIHAPNEKFHLPNFHKGIETSIRFLSEIKVALKPTLQTPEFQAPSRNERNTLVSHSR